MFVIMWNPLGFHVIDKLPDVVTMNANHFAENILGPLEDTIFPDRRAVHERRPVVHMDNAPVHNGVMATSVLADHNLVPLQHPPYSQDLAPSDFYLFPTVKKLKDIEMADEGDLFDRLLELLNDIPIRELHKVFIVWIKRLVDASKGNGN